MPDEEKEPYSLEPHEGEQKPKETPAERRAKALAGIVKAGWTVTIDDKLPGKPVVAVFANIPDDKHPPIDYKHLKPLAWPALVIVFLMVTKPF